MEENIWFDKIKDFYDTGFWSLELVRISVKVEWITKDEYKLITGMDF